MLRFSFAGLSALAVLGARAVWTPKLQAPPKLRIARSFYMLPARGFICSFRNIWLRCCWITPKPCIPKTLIFTLYSFDCSLGVQFSFLLGEYSRTHLWFRFAALVFYIALPLPLALVYAAHLRLRSKAAFPIMLASWRLGRSSTCFTNMVPALTSPRFWTELSLAPLVTSQARHLLLETIAVPGARNAIPSLHMAWVLLVWWNSQRAGPLDRANRDGLCGLHRPSNARNRRHYFVDLVVAFPFAVMVQALCLYPLTLKPRARGGWPFLFGTFASLLWMALVSFAHPGFLDFGDHSLGPGGGDDFDLGQP